MSPSPAEQRVLDRIDRDQILGDLTELVAIPSVGGSPSEQTAQQWCADRLGELGYRVDHWPIDIDALAAENNFPGQEVQRSRATGCVGLAGGGLSEQPALVLCGHTDVVPPGNLDGWPNRDPYTLRISRGVAAGRGTCDMKGGLAAIFGALTALRSARVHFNRPLAVHAVTGEEDGGLGAYATLRRGHRGKACVIAEPTGQAIIPANGGSLTFRLEVPGQGTHGSTRTRGINAFERLAGLLPALRELEQRRNKNPDPLVQHLDIPYPLSIGIVHSGDWASSVPDLAIAEGRYGVQLDEPVEQAQRAFENALASAEKREVCTTSEPVRVSWPGSRFASGCLPPGHQLLEHVGTAARHAGADQPTVHGAPYGSDLRLYAAAGIPTLQYGPGDVRYAHSHDEHVTLEELEHTARCYALLALRLCR